MAPNKKEEPTKESYSPTTGLSAQENEYVNPEHYTLGGIAMKDIWEAKLSYEELKGFYKGNLLKYIIRADHKGGLKDYEKCLNYLNWLIELVRKHENEEGVKK